MRVIYQFFKKLILIAALIIIALTVLLNSSYFVINRYYQNNVIFSKIASDVLKQPVQIKRIHIGGFSFLPIFIFHDVNLNSAIGSTTYFRDISVKVNLWDSLWKKRFVTSEIQINGLQLKINEHKKNNTASSFFSAVNWIVSQPEIELQNTKLTWCGINIHCVTLNPVNITIKNRGQKHRITADFNWLSSDIQVVAHVTGNPLDNPYAIASVFAYGHDVSFMKGWIDFKLWANYKNKQWDSAKAAFAVHNISMLGITIPKTTAAANWDPQSKKISLSASTVLFGESIRNIHATISDWIKPILSAGVTLKMPLKKLFFLLQKIPEFHANHFSDIRGDGLVKCNARIHMPLSQFNLSNAMSRLQVTVYFLNNTISIPKWHVDLSNMRGDAALMNDQLIAKNIAAVVFQTPILFSINVTSDKKIKLILQKFYLLHQDWNGLQINLSPLDSGYFIQLHNQIVFADIAVPGNNAMPVNADVHYLYWKTGEDDNAQLNFPEINPADLLSFNLVIKNLYVNQQSDGDLQLIARSRQDGLQFKKIKLHSRWLVFSAHGNWIKRHLHQETTLQGNVQSDNLGAILSQYHLSSRLKGGVLAAEFALTWPSSPQQFSMSAARGQMRIDLQHARITQLDSGTEMNLSLGHLFNLLSLESISRFLTLDFSSITKKGFAFDALRGKWDVKNGALWTRGIDIDSALAKINLIGKISLQNEQNDLLMRIAPQISSSLPTLVGLAGGPVVGAVAWVANKLASPSIGEMMEKEYHITGTWKKPVVRQIT
ncbi:MAG: hypothetical protein COY58_04810 [Gammaproteobacteria bacterium CG_4_10_14_0_8_um_filter_38_16]|nr:MAG: hypothetical protein COY58_04810 [Gammaproteobacteria bacterium CG_4_10_14_0_8_um_filter_38_16]PJA03338.1 MAG: hypothetical protein COX72_05535 [Gammaproteobacteria bacterium CG_4_10_14_0_2_um_filter_38_22]PJB10653.1 MAG: hypothetical protein CO120_03615 [Gammaproteobacteria bacterium CG_4_9_14_3_um_filter_38_9]